LLPQVPFGREAGLPGLVLESWIGIFTHSQTPSATLKTLRLAMGKVMQQADLRRRLEASGVRVLNMPAKDTEQFVKAEAEKWPKFLRQAGIKAE
jgi:tripartite-type tricarboxylate transporter receptor subunit TctC